MASRVMSIAEQYRMPLWGGMDRALRNGFKVSGAITAAVLVAILLAPALPKDEKTVNDIPERIARLIIEKPKVSAPPAPKPVSLVESPPAPPRTVPKPPPTRRRTTKPKAPPNQGTQGRELAKKEVEQNLAAVSGSLDKVMENLSKSLPASENSKQNTTPQRRRRSVRSGRSTRQLSSVGDASGVSSGNISDSAIEGTNISISAITGLTGGGTSSGTEASEGTGSSGPAGRNEFRSNESLLSVVRRYAAGIQFCYDNDLKKNPGLRGKLVVSMTVLASGEVSEASIVEDTLGSRSVTNCVLAQIRGWKFPEIPHGTTSFRTPFVFTPPE